MSEPPSPNLMKQIGNLLGEVSGFVVAIVAYLMAVTGQSPGPLPQTTAVFTVVVTTLALWAWRWSQITRQKPAPEGKVLVTGKVPDKPQLRSLGDRLLDPFRSSGARSYALSLTRRRVEAAGLALLTLATATWTGFAMPDLVSELAGPTPSPSLPMTCLGSKESTALQAVIPTFNRAEGAPDLQLAERLFDQLSEYIVGDVAVCRVAQVVSNRGEALDLGRQTTAAIVIWGRIDVAVFEVNLKVADWDLPDRTLPPLPSEEAADSTFQIREPLHIRFLTEFTLSQILYLDNRPEEAREMLERALVTARQEGLDEENPKDLAEAYFFLGFLFDTRISPNPDLERAIEAYSQAAELDPTFYRTFLNRGFAYAALGETDQAVADYTVLIEAESPLAGPAYVNRAQLQPTHKLAESDFEAAIQLIPLEGLVSRGRFRLWKWNDPPGAIEDFQQALRLTSEDPYLYHDLGQAQLIANRFDAAIQTYSDAITYMTPEDRDIIVEELGWLAEDNPHLKEPVAAIIAKLQATPPP
jgi:tetratricopeptide (TPR) repeat protein